MPTLTNYHWSSLFDCVMHETDGSGATTVVYTHEPSGFGPLLSENRGGTTFTHHYDALGSTTMLTDDAGTVTDTFAYDAWGNSVARTGMTTTPYQWNGRCGYHFDQSSGRYYVRARSYEPTVARWSSVDPLWPIDASGYYGYVMSQAVSLVDPSGLQWQLLQQTDTFSGPPIPWMAVSPPYQTNTTHISITVSPPVGHRFYRLRKP